ncbi:MAG: UDP-N-acetylmuramate dehydrogenase [Taibaiella sp.]|nr:UDP-N-acetylmuramate dehydrogenase [Taibaiella sp.]
MQIQQNVSLRPFNTFGIDVPAEYFTSITDIASLQELMDDAKLPSVRHILGGGSNVLLTKRVNGIVLQNRLKGITVIKEDDAHVWLTVGSGEVWHQLVMFAINSGWAGIENLALIPGTVGAAPIQNIGAYGVEAKETIGTVTAWHWQEKALVTYNNSQCSFGYRDSIFKHALKDQVFITSVTFRLNKQPVYKISYGAITEELERMHIGTMSIRAIANAVIAIRTSKLPDPAQIGNAGSFFKNPTIAKEHYDTLLIDHPGMPSYPAGNSTVKVPAGWLIEQCGWKGYRNGDAGVHSRQALVLVNYSNASGDQIWRLSQQIVDSVKDKYSIELEREVQVW